ncbi:MAG: hypothetical protein CENE_02066 [Candidatus Celerinatantimonas neptuna]|nr:MAG: hypothetical protein CENE_02066 [Candidatus Celerinatantimonas neptuna]
MRNKAIHIAVIGGGVAGSIAAMRLAESGARVTLLEQGQELVNGPPICHLHAGGCLYRELSDEACLTLLEQSIETARSFPGALRARPTLIAVPERDPGTVEMILPRLERLSARYHELVKADSANQVLGPAEHYYQIFSREQLETIAQSAIPSEAVKPEDWLVNAARELDLDKLKFPVVLVQEYGVSLFRVAALVQLSTQRLPSLEICLESQVTEVLPLAQGWRVSYRQHEQLHHLDVDYLINAAGYRSGEIDDLVGVHQQRLVEFKAAYLAKWPDADGIWPEVVIHGQRGTKQGMAQLTPYGNGIFQLHGMTPDITLFPQGVAKSNVLSAQPRLSESVAQLAQGNWSQQLVDKRTRAAIDYLAEFMPAFRKASVVAKPLSGAQQIPGDNLQQRVSGASFGKFYARSEIVKFSSALPAADDILTRLRDEFNVSLSSKSSVMGLPSSFSNEDIDRLADEIASRRQYPKALASTC